MATSIKHAVSGSLDLLAIKDKIVLLFIIIAQAFLALFDLIGISLIGAVVALGTSKVSGTTPFPLSKIIEVFNLEQYSESDLMLWISLSAGAILVSKSLISYLIIRKTYRFLAIRQAIVSRNLIQELMSKPILFIQQSTTQDISVALTTGANAATLGVIGSAVVMASEIPVLIVLGLALSFVDLGVTLFTIVFFGLIGLFIHLVLANQGRKLGTEVTEMEIASLEAVQEAMGSYKEIAVLGRQNYYVERIKELRWRSSTAQGILAVMNQSTKYIYEIMLIVGGGLLLGFQLMTHDVATAITIITVFLAAASRIMPSLLRMQTAAISIIYSSSVAEPTLKLAITLKKSQSSTINSNSLSKQNSYDSKSEDTPRDSEFTGKVEIENVNFTYPEATKPAIQKFSLVLGQGQSLALVGPTGAGKSTIADLILGLIVPNSGSIKISGVSPKTIIDQRPGLISYVPQSIAVIRGSIRDNVALGIPREFVNDDQVWEALERAQLSDFLKNSRNGLETYVGERGVQLSGGQRQRLGLARALYTRPKLLVLDEATSALDAETEAAITDALEGLEGEVTTITIAHRIATIRNCDVVLYLENGSESARGNFNDLRKLSPQFDHLAKLSGL